MKNCNTDQVSDYIKSIKRKAREEGWEGDGYLAAFVQGYLAASPSRLVHYSITFTKDHTLHLELGLESHESYCINYYDVSGGCTYSGAARFGDD